MDSNLEQPVSTSILTVTETAIGMLHFCCQSSVAGASGSPNNVLSIDVVGESVYVYLTQNLNQYRQATQYHGVGIKKP